MGRRGNGRITSQDIARAGGVEGLIEQAVKAAKSFEAAAQESAAQQLANLGAQNHHEHSLKRDVAADEGSLW